MLSGGGWFRWQGGFILRWGIGFLPVGAQLVCARQDALRARTRRALQRRPDAKTTVSRGRE